MRTTKMISVLLPVLLLAFSCEKPEPIEIDSGGQVCLSIDLGADTKAGNYTTEWNNEKTVHSVGYYIFDSQGRLESVWNASSSAAVSGRVTSGTKTVWAVVNIPASRFSDVRTLSQFEAKEVSFADMSPSSFLMSGKKSVYVGTGNVTTSIPVERFVARLCVAEITNGLSGSRANADVYLRSVFLSNVAGNCRITGASPATFQWYNKCARRSGGGSGALIIDEEDSDLQPYLFFDFGYEYMAPEDTSSPYCGLYMFPNPTTTDRTGWASTFTPRYTRVVVAVEIDGEVYYYPVSITGMECNHAYTLYLTITHLGSKDPDTFDFVTDQDVVITIGGFDDFDDSLEITY